MTRRKKRKRKRSVPQTFYRISYIVNANGSINGNHYYVTIEGYFFAFSTKQKWVDKLHEVVNAVTRARGIVASEGSPGAPEEGGVAIAALPRNAEDWFRIVVGEETSPIKKADLPKLPFYVATIRVNDKEIGKVDLVERDISKFPSGLGLYFKSILSGIVDEVIKWTKNLL